MKKIVLAVFLAVFSSLEAQEQAQPQRFVLDEVAAVVGDEIILSSQVKMSILQTMEQQKVAADDTARLRQLVDEVFENEVSEKILLHHAKEAKVEISEDQVNEMVGNRIKEVRNRFPSEEAFMRELARAGKTLVSLKEMYRQEERERLMSETYLRERLHELPKVKVTEEEARAYFESQNMGDRPGQVKIQHMLIAPKPSDEVVEAAKTKIDSIYKLYQGGADFAYLAQRLSDDPSAAQGGDLGYFSKGDMVKEFEDAAFAMAPGEVRMVRTKYGWHLIRVEARRQKEVRARHILVPTNITDEDWARARELAESLRKRVLEGESFYKLAKQYSEEGDQLPESPPFSLVNALPPDVARVLAGPLEKVPGNESLISNVLEIRPRGELLVLELERKEPAPYTFDEMRSQIIERLQQTKAVKAYIQKLRESTYIDIRFKGWTPDAGGL